MGYIQMKQKKEIGGDNDADADMNTDADSSADEKDKTAKKKGDENPDGLLPT